MDSGFSHFELGERLKQHSTLRQQAQMSIDHQSREKRKTASCYGNRWVAVTRKPALRNAVYAVQTQLTECTSRRQILLQQKPTTIERGVPVGTRGLKGGASGWVVSGGSLGARAMRGDFE